MGVCAGSEMCHGDLPSPDTWRGGGAAEAGQGAAPGVLYEASGWPEIGAFLFGQEGAVCAAPPAASIQARPAPIPHLPCRLAAVRYVRMEGGRRQQGPPPQPSGRRRLWITWVAVGLGQLSFAGVTDDR